GDRCWPAGLAVGGWGRRERGAGRLAGTEVPAAAGLEVGRRIGLRAGELAHAERAAKALDAPGEIALERADVEAMDVADLGGALDHRASSIPSREGPGRRPRYTPGP